MVGVTVAGGGKLLGEWKLIWASALTLARMASALKIKCPTLNMWADELTAISFYVRAIKTTPQVALAHYESPEQHHPT